MSIDSFDIEQAKVLKTKYPGLLMPFSILEIACFYSGWSTDYYCAGWMCDTEEHVKDAIEWYYEKKIELSF